MATPAPLGSLPRRIVAGPPETAPNAPAQQAAEQMQQLQIDYQGNLNVDNGMIQRLNNDKFNAYRRQAPNTGVQMKAAY